MVPTPGGESLNVSLFFKSTFPLPSLPFLYFYPATFSTNGLHCSQSPWTGFKLTLCTWKGNRKKAWMKPRSRLSKGQVCRQAHVCTRPAPDVLFEIIGFLSWEPDVCYGILDFRYCAAFQGRTQFILAHTGHSDDASAVPPVSLHIYLHLLVFFVVGWSWTKQTA